jgi:hypothetical protein
MIESRWNGDARVVMRERLNGPPLYEAQLRNAEYPLRWRRMRQFDTPDEAIDHLDNACAMVFVKETVIFE